MPGTKREDSAEMTGKATSAQRTGNILVVDHEPTIADLLIEILTDAGYIAYSMPPGAPALAAIARYSPALLLLDVQWLDKDVAALIARVRAVWFGDHADRSADYRAARGWFAARTRVNRAPSQTVRSRRPARLCRPPRAAGPGSRSTLGALYNLIDIRSDAGSAS